MYASVCSWEESSAISSNMRAEFLAMVLANIAQAYELTTSQNRTLSALMFAKCISVNGFGGYVKVLETGGHGLNIWAASNNSKIINDNGIPLVDMVHICCMNYLRVTLSLDTADYSVATKDAYDYGFIDDGGLEAIYNLNITESSRVERNITITKKMKHKDGYDLFARGTCRIVKDVPAQDLTCVYIYY